MGDLESKMQLKTISTQLMSIAVAKNTLIEQIFAIADREVDGSPHCRFNGCKIIHYLNLVSSPQYLVPREYHFDQDYGAMHGMAWQGFLRSQYRERYSTVM
jgi:hypothetical protein